MEIQLKRGMSIDECKAAIRLLVTKHGHQVLGMQWLDDHGYNALRRRINYHKISFDSIAQELDIHAEWKNNIRTKYGQLKAYTEKEVHELWSELIQKHGVVVLHKGWLRSNGHVSLHTACKRLKVSKKNIANENGILQEYINYVKGTRNRWADEQRWTKDKMYECLQDIANLYDGIPSQDFLKHNGYGAILGALARAKISFADVVDKFGGVRSRLTSKNGLTWRSYPECALSDFLYARGIFHTIGKRYEAPFTVDSNEYGIYDMHFTATKVPFKDQVIDVEIWGSKDVHYSDKYEKRKEQKLEYNKDNKNFLCMDYQSCYKDCDLKPILDQYIDVDIIVNVPVNGFITDTTNWSLIDRVVFRANEICEKLGEHNLPPSNWFRRIAEYDSRKVHHWEPESWHPFLYNISLIGGFVVLRKARQENIATRKNFPHQKTT